MLSLLIAVIVTAIIFDYINGFHDAANAIATVVSTKVLTPRQAIAMAAVFNLIGALLWVGLLVPLGYGFGNLPVIKKNFSLVIFAIIGLSILPAAIEILREWRSRRIAPGVGSGA